MKCWLYINKGISMFQILDDKNVRRRFRASNYQSTTRVKPFICTMPMRLDEGWNQIQFNVADFTRRAYGTNYVETLRVQVHANCRIRRVYFSDRLYSEDELPAEFKLFLPIQNKTRTAATTQWEGLVGVQMAVLFGRSVSFLNFYCSECTFDTVMRKSFIELDLINKIMDRLLLSLYFFCHRYLS